MCLDIVRQTEMHARCSTATMAAISSDVDDAVVVIQQASRSIEDAVQKMGSFEGKQQELLTAIKAMGERVADIEKSLALSTNASRFKEKCSPTPYERVCG